MGKYNEAYAEKYNEYSKTELGKAINRLRWGLVARFAPPPAALLDYGCGNGSFIRGAPEGYSCVGYDVNPWSGYSGNSLSILDPFDVFTAFDSIEHIDYPYLPIAVCGAQWVVLLTPEVPHDAGIEHLEKWRHFRPDEHQHMFSRLSLERMLRRAGYTIVYTCYEEGKLRNPEHPEWLITVVARKHSEPG